MSQQTDLALVDPHAVTLRTDVDLHVTGFALLEIATALRTLHVMLTHLHDAALLVEDRTHLLDQLSILSYEVFLFVAGGVFVRVMMHRSLAPPAFRPSSVVVRRPLGHCVELCRVL